MCSCLGTTLIHFFDPLQLLTTVVKQHTKKAVPALNELHIYNEVGRLLIIVFILKLPFCFMYL